MKMLHLVLSLTLVISCSTADQKSGESKQLLPSFKGEVASYQELEDQLRAPIHGHGPENTLVVFDIDNTMLQNSIHLGSEQWFYWQEGLLSGNSPQKVGKDFGDLLKVQGLLFDLDPMRLTDEHLDDLIKKLQDHKVKTIVLTSRGFEFRSATERTLKGHGLDFSRTKLGRDIGGEFVPYELSKLSKEERLLVKNSPGRKVSYMNGIFMTAGQHKGIMLKGLLEKFSARPSLIIFVDNHEKQVGRVYDVFKDRVHTLAYRYSGHDKVYQSFGPKEQARADRQWKDLKRYLERLYGRSLP